MRNLEIDYYAPHRDADGRLDYQIPIQQNYGGGESREIQIMQTLKPQLPAESGYINAGGKDQTPSTGTPPNPDGLDLPQQIFGIPTGWLLIGGAAILGLWLLSDDK